MFIFMLKIYLCKAVITVAKAKKIKFLSFVFESKHRSIRIIQ